MMDNYSLSDIRAVTEGNGMDGFGGGGGAWWIIILFLFIFGNNGFGSGGRQNDAVSYEILSNQHFNALSNQINGISDGLCQGFYALNNSVMGEGRALQTQIADCCCNTQLAVKDLAAGIHAEGEATRALIQQNEVQALRDKVTDLQLQQSQCAQNAYLINQLRPCAVPAYLTCSPYQSYNQCGCGCGCGNGMNI